MKQIIFAGARGHGIAHGSFRNEFDFAESNQTVVSVRHPTDYKQGNERIECKESISLCFSQKARDQQILCLGGLRFSLWALQQLLR